MKTNQFSLIFFFLMSVQQASSQQSYYGINTGYGLNFASQDLYLYNDSKSNHSSGESTYSIEQNVVSLGSGLNFGAFYGYKFNKSFGVELGASYLLGATFTGEREGIRPELEYLWHSRNSIKANMFRLSPAITIGTAINDIGLYARFGAVLGFGSVYREFIFSSMSSGIASSQTTKIKSSGGMGLGLTGGVGITYSLSSKWSLFGEVNVISMSYSPAKSKLTEYTVDGIDQLSTLTTSEKEVKFVDSFTYNTADHPSDEPREELKSYFPFSSLGLNIGLRIDL